MTQPTNRDRKSSDKQQQAVSRVSTKQIAKNAVRGGPKTAKKDRRVGSGRGQKGEVGPIRRIARRRLPPQADRRKPERIAS